MTEPGFEFERAYDRADLAAILSETAAALEEGHPLQLHTAEKRLAVAFPSRLTAELEAEYDAEAEPPIAGLELELEWDDPDGTTIRVETAADEAADQSVDLPAIDDGSPAGNDDSTAIDEDSSADPATAAMPVDSVTEGERSADEPVETGRERRSRFEVYQDRADEWRWRLVHWNGNIIADSGEGYSTRSNARRAVRGVMRAVPAAAIEDTDS